METSAGLDGFLRHVRACNNAVLPGQRRRFRIGAAQVGWATPAVAEALSAMPSVRTDPDGGLSLVTAEALPAIGRSLSDRGLYRWRDEAFDVRAGADGPALAQIDRGALPSFGIAALGVHVNGLVERPDGTHVWIARRSPHKRLDPGKLDHIVAGGVPAGLTANETLVKEAAEEASIPADLARQAVRRGQVSYAMERFEGLRRDRLLCYDLSLPVDFRPRPADDEVAGFELWPLERALRAVRDTDDFKFNVNLVLIDLFLRRGLIAGEAAAALRRALDAGSV